MEMTDTENKNISLTEILLPNKWELYTYDKSVFKKITDRGNCHATPHKKICEINTMNDLVYLLNIMAVKINEKTDDKINLYANNYIIMREGIEPIWEHPKNENGGTFTIVMDHTKGYDVWSLFMMYMLGETLLYDCDTINGISVSYLCNTSSRTHDASIYIKIWDGKPDRTRDHFLKNLPKDLHDMIKNESIQYMTHRNKQHYAQPNIIEKLNSRSERGNANSRKRGGFHSSYRR